jgi:hypothetical protein
MGHWPVVSQQSTHYSPRKSNIQLEGYECYYPLIHFNTVHVRVRVRVVYRSITKTVAIIRRTTGSVSLIASTCLVVHILSSHDRERVFSEWVRLWPTGHLPL